jgi:hypothetical protein
MEGIGDLISTYGFPIIAAVGLGYFVFYVWKWATEEIEPVLSEANRTLIALIDRVRMLDNDLIRLNQKLNTVLQMREKENKHKVDDIQDSIKAEIGEGEFTAKEEPVEEKKEEEKPKKKGFRYK